MKRLVSEFNSMLGSQRFILAMILVFLPHGTNAQSNGLLTEDIAEKEGFQTQRSMNTTKHRLADFALHSHLVKPDGGKFKSESDILPPELLHRLAISKPSFAPYEAPPSKGKKNKAFVPFGIIGDDDREAVLETLSFPASAITHINYWSNAAGEYLDCSGAMISKNVLITAGHCVHSGTSDGDWNAEFLITPGRNLQNSPFGTCGAKALFALKGWLISENQYEARYHDLGAIVLNCNVGEKTGWFAVSHVKAFERLPVSIRGYAKYKSPPGRQWLGIGELSKIEKGKVFHTSDTEGGTSGAPILLDDGKTILAVHTNGLHNGAPWNTYNAATVFSPTIIDTIRQWKGQSSE